MGDDTVRLRRRLSFDEDPDNYQAARPDYPARVYEILADQCGLRPGASVLEIGPGTGQVTHHLVAAGARVVAVELGAGLAERLRQSTAGQDATVVDGDFAAVNVPVPPAGFDLAVCGTAFHWLDPQAAVARLARLVRPGGWLAVWWTLFADPHRSPSWRAELDALYERYLPHERRDPQQLPAPVQVAARTRELAVGGWFAPAQVELIRWTHRLTPAAARRLWATFSNVRELPHQLCEQFLDSLVQAIDRQPGGGVVDNYVTALYTAVRRPDSQP